MITTSVITCVYNDLMGLSLTAGSVLASLAPDTELLICDDASTDGTQDVLEKWSAGQERITVLRNEKNLGPTASRNRLLNAAQGTYVSILDAGDLLLPKKISTHASILSNKASVSVVCGRAAVKAPNSRWHSLPSIGFQMGYDLAQPYQFVFSTMTFRRSALENIGGFEEPVFTAEGIDAFLKMGDHDGQAYSSQFACLKFRNPESASQRFSSEHAALITQTLMAKTLRRRHGPLAASTYTQRLLRHRPQPQNTSSLTNR
ncbi:MAG: glycosyltransferase family 2 protein [Deltaproteobacteria bacterium]|nr:glycosyltransferase family 2 protein [Deltaproteobacteria bacterium]MBI3294926.1 glycosyltransferase family 2 protein [Deltaproteobacteria bacterium]